RRMEVQVSARRHRDVPRLERKELAPADRDPGVFDRGSEYAARERDLAFRQPTLPAGRTSRGRRAQRKSPAARTSAGKLTLSPPANVRVTSACPPATVPSAR